MREKNTVYTTSLKSFSGELNSGGNARKHKGKWQELKDAQFSVSKSEFNTV